MDVTWVNLIEVLQQWVRECSHIQFCWFCRHCSSYSQKRLPLFHVTFSDSTWLFYVSSCVHVNSLLDCTESFSSVVFVWVCGATQGIAIPDYILGGKKLLHYFCEIVPEIVLSSLALWDPVWPKVTVKCTFPPFLIGTFWSVLSPLRRSVCQGHNSTFLKLSRMNWDLGWNFKVVVRASWEAG